MGVRGERSRRTMRWGIPRGKNRLDLYACQAKMERVPQANSGVCSKDRVSFHDHDQHQRLQAFPLLSVFPLSFSLISGIAQVGRSYPLRGNPNSRRTWTVALETGFRSFRRLSTHFTYKPKLRSTLCEPFRFPSYATSVHAAQR